MLSNTVTKCYIIIIWIRLTILLFLLFGLPFVVYPFGVGPYEPVRVIVAESAMAFLIVAFLISQRSGFFDSKKLLQIGLISIVFILCLVHMMLYGGENAFFGNVFRLQGIWLLWLLLLFSFTVSGQINKQLVGWISLVALLFLTLTALLMDRNISGRAVGTLGEPNALAATVIFFWPWTFYLKLRSRLLQGMVRLVVLLAVCGVLLLSGSRSGMMALAIQLVVVLGYWKKWFSLPILVLIALGLFLVSLTTPFIDSQRDGWESRSEIWRTAVHVGFYSGIKRPLIGSGFGLVETRLAESADMMRNTLRYMYVDSSHNIWLDWWAQGGIVGVVTLVSFVGLALYYFVKAERVLEICLLFGLMTVLSFNPASVVTLVMFWWTVGQGFSGEDS